MKKIAIFQKDLMVGGIQKSLVNTLNILGNKYDIDLYLYSSNNDFYIDKIPQNIHVINLKSSKFRQLLPFNIFNKLFREKYIEKEYDYAIDYNGYQNDTACGAINVKSKKKIIWIHNDMEKRMIYDKKYRYLFKMGKSKFNYFDSFVFVSDGAMNSFDNLMKLKDKEKVVIANQIDDELIRERAIEKCDLEVDKDKYNIVTVGRLVYAKGFDLLLYDIKRLREYRNDFHLYFIGDGSEYDNLVSLCNKLDLSEYVTFLGRKNNPYQYMNLMDGFVLTSRYEGQGMVIMEAKTLGLELFISKHLENYNKGEVIGYNDIVGGLKDAKKKKKKMISLNEYNDKNKEKLLNLLK